MITVKIPFHLQTLAGIRGDVQLKVTEPITLHAVIDVLESKFPSIQGTLRDYATKKRRPLIRFYACEEDISNEAMDGLLPEVIRSGKEPLWIIGAIAGG